MLIDNHGNYEDDCMVAMGDKWQELHTYMRGCERSGRSFAKGKLLQDRVARLKQIAWWQWGERRKNQNDVHSIGLLRER